MHGARDDLEAGLDRVRGAPADAGTLELIVRRPAEEEREILAADELDIRAGLVGDVVIEVPEAPHLGYGKFARRFGVEALKLVDSEVGRSLRLRGLNARVVEPGAIRRGAPVRKL